MYTIVPFMIIGVLFYYTVVAQNKVLANDPDPDAHGRRRRPEVVVDLQLQGGRQPGRRSTTSGRPARSTSTPDLYLPVGKSVRFNLSSPDVIHSFWIPAFYQKLDVVPGRHNRFHATPTKEGVFPGKCAELCGTYHSAMLFNVHVVSEAEYNAYLKTLAAKGQTGEAKAPSRPNHGTEPARR